MSYTGWRGCAGRSKPIPKERAPCGTRCDPVLSRNYEMRALSQAYRGPF
jgi:predicted nucleic acid-binding Zn ribbon protein